MAAGSGKELLDAVLSAFAPEGTSAAQSLCKGAFAEFKARASKVIDSNATYNSTYTFDDSLAVGLRIRSCKFVPTEALVADNSNYADIDLVWNDGAGGADTTIASLNTKVTGTGNWVADIAESLTLDNAEVKVAAGSQLQVKITKQGSGVAVPAGTFILKADWE